MKNIRLRPATVWRIAAPYFRSEDKFAGRLLLAAVIAIELTVVAINVLLNQWNNRFYTALQEKDWDGFVREIGIFCILATAYIALAVYQLYLNQWLQIRWRNWLTHHYLGEWLHGATHYRMQLRGDAADNPDQRIADDVKMFVDQTLNICVSFLSAVVTLASFIVILWGLSESAADAVRQRIPYPRLSGVGRPDLCGLRNGADALDRLALVMLNFQQQRFEADFRFNLVRVRENSEQIALLRGEGAEQERLLERFGRVVQNWYEIMTRTKRLTAFTSSYAQAAVVFPYVLVAPAYFADKIQLGGMMQTASAFSSVQQALSFFVSVYRTLAEWSSVVARLEGFEEAIASAAQLASDAPSIEVVRSDESKAIELRQFLVKLPNGTPLITADGLLIRNNERVLVTGSVRGRQVDLVPRDRRHLAVRRRRDCDPCQSHADDAAAAAVFSDRSAEGGDRLSCESGRIHSGSRRAGARLGGPAAARIAAGRGSALESDALARRATAAWSCARAFARAAISFPR